MKITRNGIIIYISDDTSEDMKEESKIGDAVVTEVKEAPEEEE